VTGGEVDLKVDEEEGGVEGGGGGSGGRHVGVSHGGARHSGGRGYMSFANKEALP